jgi:hypothetical protein
VNPWRWLFAAKVRVLRLRPGDVVLLEAPLYTSKSTLELIKEAWAKELPDVPVAVLGGLTLAGVVRQLDDDGRTTWDDVKPPATDNPEHRG